jgi:hypothetical protein
MEAVLARGLIILAIPVRILTVQASTLPVPAVILRGRRVLPPSLNTYT